MCTLYILYVTSSCWKRIMFRISTSHIYLYLALVFISSFIWSGVLYDLYLCVYTCVIFVCIFYSVTGQHGRTVWLNGSPCLNMFEIKKNKVSKITYSQYRYNVVHCSMILHTALQWLRQKINKKQSESWNLCRAYNGGTRNNVAEVAKNCSLYNFFDLPWTFSARKSVHSLFHNVVDSGSCTCRPFVFRFSIWW